MIFYIWQDLEWFFEIYLRQPELPVLVSSRESNILNIHWEVPGNYSFPMPIDIKIGNSVQRVEIPDEGTAIKIENNIKLEIDPQNWILFREEYPDIISLDSSLLDIYTGKYQTEIRDRTETIEIKKMGQNLIYETDRLSNVPLMPISKTDFFFKEAENKRVTFTFDEKGCIESLSYIDNQRNITYKKVD